MLVIKCLDPAFPPRARAWQGELPSLPTRPSQVVQRGMEVPPSPWASRSMAAIEVFLPRGGRFIYGLLGGAFTPNDSKELVVQVASSEAGQTITDWSLARGLDAVRSGIPPWAVEDILNAALENTEGQTLGPGCLSFHLGAHGEIGSSTWVFRGLTHAVISLVSKDGPLSEAGLSSILRRHFG
jgi:hypothetical protein